MSEIQMCIDIALADDEERTDNDRALNLALDSLEREVRRRGLKVVRQNESVRHDIRTSDGRRIYSINVWCEPLDG